MLDEILDKFTEEQQIAQIGNILTYWGKKELTRNVGPDAKSRCFVVVADCGDGPIALDEY